MIGWLTPLYPFFIMTGISIVADTYFGYKLARRKKQLDSRKFSRVLYKLLIYNIIVISGYSLDIYLLGDFVGMVSPVNLTVTKAIVFGVLVSELMSIDESLIALDGKGLRHYFKNVLKLIKILNKERKDL